MVQGEIGPGEGERVVVVTGASAGFGQLIAGRFAQRRWRVVGTSRRAEATGPEGVAMRRLDVTDPGSVGEFVDRVTREFGRVDVLVNNAGTTHIGLAETTGEAETQRVFETNFFGAVRLTRAVLPGMRDRGSGRIITISSLAGLVPAPGQAVYCASKHAVEGYMESLRYEVGGSGVDVSLIEPGFFKTSLHAAASGGPEREAGEPDPTTTAIESAYGEMPSRLAAAVDRSFAQGGDPAVVAAMVVHVAEAANVRMRYRVGGDARWVPRIRRWLPEGMFERGVRRKFGLG